jgi:urease accessory protein UreH
VQLSSNARLSWRDEFMLDRRSLGGPGTWRSQVRVTRDGWPVVASDVGIGPASPLWSSPAVLDGAQAFCSLVVVDPGQSKETWQPSRVRLSSAIGVSLPLSSAGVHIMAWGENIPSCRTAVEKMLGLAGVPAWAQVRWDRASGHRSD